MASAIHPVRHAVAFIILLLFWLTAVDTQGQGARVVPVTVAPVTEREIQRTLRLTGTVTSERAAQLSVATEGLVTHLQVDAGDRVSEGDLLLELDAELARFQWQSAVADVSRARQALADARRRLDEARRLAPQQSIAETAVRDLESEVAEDDAALQRALALAGFRKGILDRHRLVAPFPGVISARYSDIGEWVTPGDAVLDLVATDSLRLDFQVSEDYLGAVKDSARVEFSLAGNPRQRHIGKVIAQVPVTDPTARTFLLRVAAVNSAPGMLPGMSVNAELSLATGGRGVVVPRDAVLRYADGRSVVWVIEDSDGSDRALERLVQTGLVFDGMVEVTAGVVTGERVVVEGNEALRPGQAVTARSMAGR
jgi:RND family efflux transporter MFP subunit